MEDGWVWEERREGVSFDQATLEQRRTTHLGALPRGIVAPFGGVLRRGATRRDDRDVAANTEPLELCGGARHLLESPLRVHDDANGGLLLKHLVGLCM